MRDCSKICLNYAKSDSWVSRQVLHMPHYAIFTIEICYSYLHYHQMRNLIDVLKINDQAYAYIGNEHKQLICIATQYLNPFYWCRFSPHYMHPNHAWKSSDLEEIWPKATANLFIIKLSELCLCTAGNFRRCLCTVENFRRQNCFMYCWKL